MRFGETDKLGIVEVFPERTREGTENGRSREVLRLKDRSQAAAVFRANTAANSDVSSDQFCVCKGQRLNVKHA